MMFSPARITAALEGPAREVLVTVAIQPRLGGWAREALEAGHPILVGKVQAVRRASMREDA